VQAYSPETDPLLPRAKALVTTAREVGVGSYEPMVSQFPSLAADFAKKHAAGHWEFIIATAGIYIAAARLQNLQVGAQRELALMGEVSVGLAEWDPVNARACFENCKDGFAKNFEALTAQGVEPRFLAAGSIGLWVAWNILDRPPQTEEEGDFVSRIGGAITHGFFGWWNLPA
jgi:hypothetical protein